MPTSYPPDVLRCVLLSKLENIKYLAATSASTSSQESDRDSDSEWRADDAEQDWEVCASLTPGDSEAEAEMDLQKDLKVRYAYVKRRSMHVWKVSCPVVSQGGRCIMSRKVSGVQHMCGFWARGTLVRRVSRGVCRAGVYVYYLVVRGHGGRPVTNENTWPGKAVDEKEEGVGREKEIKSDGDWDGDWELLRKEGEMGEEQSMKGLNRHNRARRFNSVAAEGVWGSGLSEDVWNELILTVRGMDGV